MWKYNRIACTRCGNDVTVNMRYELHKCLFCGNRMRIVKSKNGKRIIDVIENNNFNKENKNENND